MPNLNHEPAGTSKGGQFANAAMNKMIRKGAGVSLSTAEKEKLINDWTNDATKYRELDEQGKAQDMVEAIGDQPKYDGLAYRGMIVDEETYQSMMEDDNYEIKGLSSFSFDKKQTFMYSDVEVTGEDGKGVSIRTRVKNARDIQNSGEIIVRRVKYKIVSRLPDPSNPNVTMFVMDEVRSSVWK